MVGFKALHPDKLLPHEQINYHRVVELLPDIAKNGILVPIAVAEYDGQYIILDGHHRWHIARLLRYNYVPVAVFDYSHDDLLVLDYKTMKPLDKEKVLDKILKGHRFPPKSTYHAIRHNGSIMHVSEYLEKILSYILA